MMGKFEFCPVCDCILHSRYCMDYKKVVLLKVVLLDEGKHSLHVTGCLDVLLSQHVAMQNSKLFQLLCFIGCLLSYEGH